MITRVFGKVDGTEVIFEHVRGDIWEIPVPLDMDGEYIVEIIAENSAGRQSMIARLLYTVNAGHIKIHELPLNGYLFERQKDRLCISRIKNKWIFKKEKKKDYCGCIKGELDD